MRWVFIAAGSGLILLLLASTLVAALDRAGTSYADLARDSAEAVRIERESEIDAFWAPIRAGALNVAMIAAMFGGLAAAGAWGSLALWRFFRERWPDRAGMLPVLAADQDTARAAISGFHTARVEEARRQLVPQSLSYAPHFSNRVDSTGVLAAPIEQSAGELPTFAALLNAGKIGRGQALCLGVDAATGEGVWGSWKDLYSAGIGGQQGSGKSWTAASLIAQSMLNGARVILCDPHAGDEESLSTRLAPLVPYCELVATDSGSILEAARYAADMLGRRRDKGDSDRTPWLLVIDEWTSLLRRDEKLSHVLPVVLPDLSQEGRKFFVNALLLAQRWEAGAAGGSDVRNTLTAHYVHRCRSDEGRMQTGLRAGNWPGDPFILETGHAYLFTTRGVVRKVTTPQMTPADLVHVGLLLGGSAGPQLAAGPRPIGFHTPASGRGADVARTRQEVAAASAPESGESAHGFSDAERTRILARFTAGASVHEVTSELADTNNPGDRRYKAMRPRVEALLRSLLIKAERGAR